MNTIRFHIKRREVFADKLLDLSHLILGGTFIGQFITGEKFSFSIAAFGFSTWVLLYIISYLIIPYESK